MYYLHSPLTENRWRTRLKPAGHFADRQPVKVSASSSDSMFRRVCAKGFMPVLALFLAALCAGCSTPEVLMYGTKMNAVEKGWGKPDDTMAYQDYKDTGYYSVASVGGSWSPQGGSVSGFSFGETYTPTAIVWIYKNRGKALIFEKRGLLFDEQHTLIMKWKLVGWKNLKPDEQSAKSTTPAPSS
jgi:hypothetical protein